MEHAKVTRSRVELRRAGACCPVHLTVGPFGYFDQCISLNFLDAVLNNTVTVLLFTQRHIDAQ